MSNKKIIDDLNRNFKYVSDKEQYHWYDVWTVARLVDGKLQSDCEGYSLTLRKLLGGDIYFCKHNGTGHAILKMPNGKYVDNIQREEFDLPKPLYRSVRRVKWLELHARLLLGTIVVTINKIFGN
ncbi:MAG: hypothetical protein ACJA0H_000417 [Francisellaceae bacterium]|jgi:hypothetical protein